MSKRRFESPSAADLLAFRKRHGLTQTEAAYSAGVCRRQWQAWEYGEATCPGATWELLQIMAGEKRPEGLT